MICCLVFSVSCDARWNLIFMMLRCLTTSWPYLLHATLLHPSHVMSRCLMSSELTYAVWTELVVMVLSWRIFSLPHAALPDPSHIMPIRFIFPTSCSSVWSCFHDATLLDMIYFMLRCFTLPMSYKAAWHFCLDLWTCLHIATLLDRLYLTLHCLTLNYYVVLFALPLLPCFTFSTSCQTASRPLH